MRKFLFILLFFLIIAAVVDPVSTTLNVPLMSKEVVTYQVYDENGVETQRGGYTGPVREANESIVYLSDWALQSFTVTAILIGILSSIDHLINLKYRKMSFMVPSMTFLLVVWRLGVGVSNLLLYLTFRGGG